MISTLSRFGVSFEIVFRGITRQDSESEGGDSSGKRRRNWISGAREIVRATEGKGVVLISGAKNSNEMRGPQDLINLYDFLLLSSPLEVARRITLLFFFSKVLIDWITTKSSKRFFIYKPSKIYHERS